MTCQADIQREFFKILAVRQRSHDNCTAGPGLNKQAANKLYPAFRDFIAAHAADNKSRMRAAIMELAVNAMLVRYSLDDALI